PSLLQNVFRIFNKVDSFRETYESVSRWAAPIQRIASVLEPQDNKTSESVKQEMTAVVEWLEKTDAEPSHKLLVETILRYTKGFWKGLFTCYDNFLSRARTTI